MMRVPRRQFLVATGAFLAAPLYCFAQPRGTVRSLGYLRPDPEPLRRDGRGVATGELEDLGWREGRNLRIERAWGTGKEDQLPALAAELVRKNVDVILAIGPEAATAAARATRTIPIVFWGVGQPVEQGLVDSLARPGGNVTGLAWSAALGVATKQLELLKEILPLAERIAWLEAPSASTAVSGERLAEPRLDIGDAGRRLGFDLFEEVVQRPEDFDAAFTRILEARPQAIAVRSSMLTWRERKRIADFALRQRLPSVFGERDYVEAGGLISYGVNWRATVPPTVAYVDKILRGAKPTDLPVELPSKYELVVNLRTAKMLGTIVPGSILLRADLAIE